MYFRRILIGILGRTGPVLKVLLWSNKKKKKKKNVFKYNRNEKERAKDQEG